MKDIKYLRDIKYGVISFRLEDQIKEELRKRRKQFKSWNLFFKKLLEESRQD